MESVNGFNGSEMVEVFSNGITSCVAPQDIANKFFTELTDGERAKITDGFERDQDFMRSNEATDR
jgi:hypothetical protein